MPRHVPLAAAVRLRSVASTVAVVALAACGDSPTTPAAGVAPSASRAAAALVARDPGVSVTLQIADQGGTNDYGVPGTTVEFKTSAGAAKSVVDNSAADADARVGYYRVSMPKAVSYTATVVVLPDEFSTDGASKTVSAFVTPTWVAMGKLTLMRKPGLTVMLYKSGALVGGQTVKVTGPDGWTTTITDGSAADEDFFGNPGPSDGKISLRLPVTGTYSVCATTTPQAGWAAQCQQVWALQYFIAYSAALTYEQVWFFPVL